MIATAPGKLILTGEYAVLDGAPALVIAIDRRVVAQRTPAKQKTPYGSSPFLLAVARQLGARLGDDHPAAHAALEIAVDSSAFYDGRKKLGLGSSAAVTVAATALALASNAEPIDRELVLEIALAAHAEAQGTRGARGSGADITVAVHGGTIVYTMARAIERRRWPAGVMLIPFFTGVSADTATLVDRVNAARETNRDAVDAALAAITAASQAACASLKAPAELAGPALIAAMRLAAQATDRLAIASGVELVPACVAGARIAMQSLGGIAKTTGAGGGDVGVAVIPATADATLARRLLIEAACQPLQLSVDETGVDTRPVPQ